MMKRIQPIFKKLLLSRFCEKRLLVIYDLSSQPFSIGDILVMHAGSLVLMKEYGLNTIDFALVYDPKNPAMRHPAFSYITEKNYTYHLTSIYPVVQINPHLGSIFIFNSHKQLLRFVEKNRGGYQVWPPISKLAQKKYLYYEILNDLIYGYYKKNKTIPHLSCREFLLEWAQLFFKKNVYPSVPVTVQIRNNKKYGFDRNMDVECWRNFFMHCEKYYPVKFVIICSLSEVDVRLRQCPNVIIAKDHQTGIEQDLALICEAPIYMGASSGPGTMAVCNKKPYLFVKSDLNPDLYQDMIQEGKFLRFGFANPLQRYARGPETVELLMEEFSRIWSGAGMSDWKCPEKSSDEPPDAVLGSYLR